MHMFSLRAGLLGTALGLAGAVYAQSPNLVINGGLEAGDAKNADRPAGFEPGYIGQHSAEMTWESPGYKSQHCVAVETRDSSSIGYWETVVPVKPETVMPLLGYRAIVEGILALHELPGEKLGGDRAVSLPALTVTVAEMIEALHRVAGDRPLGKITVEPDPFIEAIVKTWPLDTYHQRALDLGLPIEDSLDEIVAYYIEDYLSA